MTQTIVLITGATRGLGRAMVQRFLALPNHTVIAFNRNPSDAASASLDELPKGDGSGLLVVRYDAAAERSAFDAVAELRARHGVARLDVVVPNAAISREYPYARDVRRASVLEHVAVNVLAVLSLFQATRDLLRASARPVFAPMGSGAGYLGRQPPIPSSVYGPSKAMLFWYGVRINAEEEWLNCFVIDPGWLQTDMGDDAARHFGLEGATIPVDGPMDGVVHLLRTATKEEHGGRAVLYTGEVQEW
ncbi:putative aflatoxin biosynthesis ketoreductase nor-1 [Rosellinia necatrix]|uniref:Putative aflatoxin biosynthesis ketoreductase nor-1 n=1 Tax=Rosellinia necatrix TaxID=77044 RepID=A0A1S8A5P2_ROSNE|nr:putative aflatoxin biosynthesis ketoreductase nor-1 [Rosellinia necatrix]